MRLTCLAAMLLATTFIGAVPVSSQALPPPAPIAGDGPEDAKLKQLFYASDERDLKNDPLQAIFRGDMRYADRFGEYLTDARTAQDKRNVEQDLAAIAAIDRSKLTRVDQIAYDVFRNGREVALRGFAPNLVAIDRLLPLSHFGGFQTFYPDFASGKGGAPFKTVADYENNLRRNAGYAAVYDRAIARFREGMAKGVTQPKLVVRNMIGQFDNLIAEGVEKSTIYAPVTMFPASIPTADRTRLTAAYAKQVREVINPAHVRMRDFLANEYLASPRHGRAVGAAGRGRALCPADRGQHDAAARARGGASARPVRGRADHAGDGGAEGRGRVQGHARRLLRPSAHRSSLPAQVGGGGARGL